MEQLEHAATCQDCQEQFSITAWDLEFYAKADVPEPSRCPDCREQLRCLHINQLNLFKRRCDATGDSIVSMFPQDSPYTVYGQKYWYSDAFDGTKYAREFDFSRPFFEQYAEFSLEVPRPSLFTDYLKDENSAYTNFAGRNKNCYLIFDSDENWDCYYSYGINSSRNSIDCYRSQELELCHEAVDCKNCYNCAYIYNSETCTDSFFLNSCIGCKNCFFCCNLRHSENYIMNKPASKEEVENFRQQLKSRSFVEEQIEKFAEYRREFPQKVIRGFRNENVSGDYLINCRNAHDCYDSRDLWDGRYCSQIFMKSKDCMDCHEVGEVELGYECCNMGYNAYNVRFSLQCLNQVNNITYSDFCFNGCENLFGCIGLKRKKFCIFNKEYSETECRALVEKITAHMKETKEWGSFFPKKLSPWPYNLSIAQVLYPLSKEEALARGFSWRDLDEREFQPASASIPDRIDEAAESISKEVLSCRGCSKNYRIIPQELKLLKTLGVPLPDKCFHCRNVDRYMVRTPRHLWKRPCSNCNEEQLSTYAPQRLERVFCEKCFEQEVY